MHKAREVAAVTIDMIEGILSVAQDAMKCNDFITGQVYAGCAADAADAAIVDFRFYANNTVWPEAADYLRRAETVVETARTISSDCYDGIRNSVRAANKAYADATLNIGQSFCIGQNGKPVCAWRLRVFRLRLALTGFPFALGVWVVTVVAVGWVGGVVGVGWVGGVVGIVRIVTAVTIITIVTAVSVCAGRWGCSGCIEGWRSVVTIATTGVLVGVVRVVPIVGWPVGRVQVVGVVRVVWWAGWVGLCCRAG